MEENKQPTLTICGVEFKYCEGVFRRYSDAEECDYKPTLDVTLVKRSQIDFSHFEIVLDGETPGSEEHVFHFSTRILITYGDALNISLAVQDAENLNLEEALEKLNSVIEDFEDLPSLGVGLRKVLTTRCGGLLQATFASHRCTKLASNPRRTTMTNEELKAWRKARKAARRAVVREAMAYTATGGPDTYGDLVGACDKLREIEAKAPKGESDE